MVCCVLGQAGIGRQRRNKASSAATDCALERLVEHGCRKHCPFGVKVTLPAMKLRTHQSAKIACLV